MNVKDICQLIISGDSISKGIAWDTEKKKYVPLEQNYGRILSTKMKCQISNAAHFGNTLPRGVSKLERDVLRLNPDFVLLEYGGNDCDHNWQEVADNPDGTHIANTDFNEFETQLSELVTRLKKNQITPLLMNLPPIDADRYFDWISQNNSDKARKILRWLGNVTRIYWWQERYNAAIMSVAEQTHTDLIDVRSSFLKYPDFRDFICVDGIHPNENGHRLIADKILNYMRNNYQYLVKKSAPRFAV